MRRACCCSGVPRCGVIFAWRDARPVPCTREHGHKGGHRLSVTGTPARGPSNEWFKEFTEPREVRFFRLGDSPAVGDALTARSDSGELETWRWDGAHFRCDEDGTVLTAAQLVHQANMRALRR